MNLLDRQNSSLRYTFECRDTNGLLRWSYKNHNFIPNEGLDFHINTFYISPSWYLGLIVGQSGGGGITFAAGDTAAGITVPPAAQANVWSEEVHYTAANRLLLTFTTISGSGQAISNAVI